MSALGILVFIGISYTMSVNRQAVRWRTVAWGLGLEFLLALLILKTPWGLNLFKSLGDIVSTFLGFSDVGAEFVFGKNFKIIYLPSKYCRQLSFSLPSSVYYTTTEFCSGW